MGKRAYRSALCGTVAFLASIVSQPANAQTPEPVAADTAVADSGLDEIIVTAQKRAQNLQHVPITVSVVSGEFLSALGTGSTRDLPTLVPGLVFARNAGAGTPFLRGVGQASGNAGIEPAVAFYIDGVYVPTAGANFLSLANVAQVAVLKGPQGTLFGRNTTGGIIQVTTLDPTDEPRFDLDLGYGNYRTVRANAYAATPLSDGVKTSFAFAVLNQYEGWGRNITLNKEIFDRSEITAHNKTIFTLGEDTNLTSSILYTRTAGYVGPTWGIFPGSLADDGVTRYISEYVVASGADTELTTEQVLGSLTLEHDMSWARLRAMGSIQDYDDDLTLAQNPIPFGLNRASVFHTKFPARTYTSEFQIQSPSGQDFNWIAGLYYFNDRARGLVGLFRDARLLARQNTTQKARSYAVFGEVSKTIFPDTRLTLGARYTIDKKALVGEQRSPTGALITTFAAIAAANGFPTEKTWKKPTFRVSLDHSLTEDVMVFASWNRGYKSGIYNLLTLNNAPADPEEIDAFEVGTKTTLFDRRLRFNISGFYYNYRDMQLRTIAPVPPATILFNAATSRIKGVDVDFQAALTQNLDLSGGFEILDAKYRSFPGGLCSTPLPQGGTLTAPCDLSGGRMLRAPKFSGNIGIQYRIPLSGEGEIALAANDNYNSGFNWEVDGRLKQESYHSISASAKWTLPGGDTFVKIWGTNLADEIIRSVGSQGASDIYGPGEPRTYGFTFGTNL